MARTTSDPADTKGRRREQNKLAQRRFRWRNNQRKAAELLAHPTPSPSSNSNSGQEPRTEDATLSDTPAMFTTSTTVPAYNLQSPRVTAPDLFDDFDLSGINNIFMPEFESMHPPDILQPLPVPATSEPETHISRPYMSRELSIVPGNNSRNGSETCDYVENDLGRPWISPLHRAIQSGHSKIVQLLLEHKANCNEKERGGLTPLIHAIIGGYEDVVDSLLSHGASIELVDDEHRSALHWAVINRRERLLKRLLKHCAGDSTLINGCTKEGRTPLLIAIDTGFEAAVEVLLESGADVHFRGKGHGIVQQS